MSLGYFVVPENEKVLNKTTTKTPQSDEDKGTQEPT